MILNRFRKPRNNGQLMHTVVDASRRYCSFTDRSSRTCPTPRLGTCTILYHIAREQETLRADKGQKALRQDGSHICMHETSRSGTKYIE